MLDPMTEAALERRLAQRVRDRGGVTLKIAPLVKGSPDRLVITARGDFHFIELKTEKGRLSPAQVVWHQRLRERTGVRVWVTYGAAELDEVLDQIC